MNPFRAAWIAFDSLMAKFRPIPLSELNFERKGRDQAERPHSYSVPDAIHYDTTIYDCPGAGASCGD